MRTQSTSQSDQKCEMLHLTAEAIIWIASGWLFGIRHNCYIAAEIRVMCKFLFFMFCNDGFEKLCLHDSDCVMHSLDFDLSKERTSCKYLPTAK